MWTETRIALGLEGLQSSSRVRDFAAKEQKTTPDILLWSSTCQHIGTYNIPTNTCTREHAFRYTYTLMNDQVIAKMFGISEFRFT